MLTIFFFLIYSTWEEAADLRIRKWIAFFNFLFYLLLWTWLRSLTLIIVLWFCIDILFIFVLYFDGYGRRMIVLKCFYLSYAFSLVYYWNGFFFVIFFKRRAQEKKSLQWGNYIYLLELESFFIFKFIKGN